ncbi:MAG: HNH endonuclease domain-containing protein [Sideroxyarcus sp.]|nr:HNH endonuclease domain-containing protein [Sideroxyarcus sp.]
MTGYLESVFQIVRAGLNTSSYKFGLLRALVALAPGTDLDRPTISIAALAEKFVEMYWPLEVIYHLRQATNPDRDPAFMKEIRQLILDRHVRHGQSLDDFKRCDPVRYGTLLRSTEKLAFRYVISVFHNLRGATVTPALFSHEGDISKGITLNAGAREFLITHGRLIDFMTIAAWVDFSESVVSAPKLFLKLSGERATRKNIAAKWGGTLKALQDGHCFYCSASDSTEYHVDHFLPWSYVLEDKTWNLVLACRACNSDKSDRLPPSEQIERLVTRNDMLVKGQLPDQDMFLRDFVEWRARDLAGHVRSLHDQARVEQFPVWERSGVPVIPASTSR